MYTTYTNVQMLLNGLISQVLKLLLAATAADKFTFHIQPVIQENQLYRHKIRFKFKSPKTNCSFHNSVCLQPCTEKLQEHLDTLIIYSGYNRISW